MERALVGTGEAMRISVIGTGHLGATHAACLAVVGHHVMGVDRGLSEDIWRVVTDAGEPGLACDGVEPVAAAVRAAVRAVV
jgi:predicted dinucleotide-binding enzyme